MAEPRKPESHYCKYCDRSLPLTEEHWHRATQLPSGFATHMCKECRREYNAERAYKYRREQKLRTLEKEQFQPEHFGDFEALAMKDQIKRAKQKTGSMDMEIL